MTQIWRLNLIFVILAIIVILLPLISGRVAMPFFQSDRAIGGPLDGDWYAIEDDGCFNSSAVYHFSMDTLVFRRRGTEIEFGTDVDSASFDEVHQIKPDFRFPSSYDGITGLMASLELHSSPASQPDMSVFIFFEDRGAALKPLNMIVDGELVDLERKDIPFKSQWDLRRCATPTVWGFIQSLWRSSYNSNDTFTPIQLNGEKQP